MRNDYIYARARLIFAVFYTGLFFFFQAEDGIRDGTVTGVQTCALPIFGSGGAPPRTPSDRLYQYTTQCTRRSRRRGRTAGHRCRRATGIARPPAAGGTPSRSEERRVGKGGRSLGGTGHWEKKERDEHDA